MSRMPSNPDDRKLEIVTKIPDKAMVIFAHPDDAEISSGGVIARWISAGCEVTYVLCTNGLCRVSGFQHRDHRKAGITATDAVYPYARDHLHFPEHLRDAGLEPHRVRELWYWGMD